MHRQHCPGIAGGIWPVGPWIAEALGEGAPNPFTTPFDEQGRYFQRRQRLLHERGGDLGFGSPDPDPWFSVPQHDGRIVIATAYGAPYPGWDGASGSFWPGGGGHVWEGLATVADVEAIAVPDWDRNPLVQESRQVWETLRREVGPEALAQRSLDWTDWWWRHPGSGETYRFSVFPSFLDLGAFLMGPSAFLTALATDPELGQALLCKCYEISASYSDAMCELYGRPRTAWCSMGGDNSCLVSAGMYRDYAMPFDALVRGKCGNIPRNLHSCGASRHLYDVWAEYPERERIVVMQTRAVAESMAGLRRALPETYIELTIHQPQFDFERESPDRVRELVWRLAEEMGFRDASLTVIVSRLDDQTRANIVAFQDTVKAVNAEAERRNASTED